MNGETRERPGRGVWQEGGGEEEESRILLLLSKIYAQQREHGALTFAASEMVVGTGAAPNNQPKPELRRRQFFNYLDGTRGDTRDG